MPLDTVYSVCPHDCPSACALALERIDGVRIGRVRGAEAQSYTQGVVCAKVARYAERQQCDDLFVCVHEQFLTETAAMADIVLPATTFLEHDDIYTAVGHHFLQIGRAVLPPHGESRSNHAVICALAERLGARHPGFAMTAFELIEHTLRASGLPGPAAFAEGVWLDCWPGFETGHFLKENLTTYVCIARCQ